MTFTESIKTCFRKYFTFSGRASRSEFWWFTLFAIVLGLVASGLETAINAATGTPDGPLILSSAASLATLIPGLAVTWRRLHDIDRSGLWYPGLVLVLPAVTLGVLYLCGFVLALILAAFDQTAPRWLGTGAQMVTLISIAGFYIILLYWLCKASQPGPNRFGPNPHEVTE